MKNAKLEFFQRGQSMVLVKNWKISLTFRFMQNTPRKSIWWRSRQKTSLSRQYKHRLKKKGKIGIFPKGIVHDFGQKVEVFLMFCVYQKQIEKKCLLTFQIKKKPLKTIKTSDYKKRKIRIFPKGLVHRFGQKFEISSTLIFYAKQTEKKYLGTFQLEESFYNPL